MMKKLTVFLLVIAFYKANGQDSLQTFNYHRETVKKTGMEILGTWAIINLATGAAASYHTTGSTKYFYQMDALWNIANLGAALSGYISAVKNTGKPLSPAESLKQQRKIESIFLVNGALDLAYIGTGIYLHKHGNQTNSDKLRGYGSGIIFQGAFLLLFDATMYSSERNNGNKLSDFLEKNPVIFDGKKIGMVYYIGR